MKKYEHRQWVCEHERNVGEKYVLPQAQAFGLSWSMATAQSFPLRCTEECPLGATGWRSPPDPTDKLAVDKGPGVVPAQALERMSGLNERTPLPARQCNYLQSNQTTKAHAG